MWTRFLAVAALLTAAACGGANATSTEVGALCASDRDCDNRCTTSDTFGRGMCTRACASDNDCPGGSLCVDRDGGICAVSCANDQDCADFGRAFLCKDMKRKSGGDGLVCRVP